MVWDSRRDRALMFGGDRDFGVPLPGTFQLLFGPAPHWEPLATHGTAPPARTGCSAVYDSLRDRMLVFGGRTSYPDAGSNELWELRLSGEPTWSRLVVAPDPLPRPRHGAGMALDREDRLIVFGGDCILRDSTIWVLPLSETALRWRNVVPAGGGPGLRMRHAMAYSPATHRLLIFGGEQFITTFSGGFADPTAWTWELALVEPMRWLRWSYVPGDSVPQPEVGGTLVSDPTGRYAWLIPGGQSGYQYDPAIWRYDFSASKWTMETNGYGGPGIRAAAAACFAKSRGQVVIHGGASGLLDGVPFRSSLDTWTFTPDSDAPWNCPVLNPESAPSFYQDRIVQFDPVDRQLVTWTQEGVWTFDVGGPGIWQLAPVPHGQGPTFDNAMQLLDTVRRHLLVFGGSDRTTPSPATSLWSWALDGPPAWNRIAIEGAPPAGTSGRQCAFDAMRDRVLVLPDAHYALGGYAALDTVPVLELSGATPRWTRLAPTGTLPLARSNGTVVVDTAHDRMFLVGGVVPTNEFWLHPRDVWTLSLDKTPKWSNQIGWAEDSPAMARCGIAIDPTLDRLLVIGGDGFSPFEKGSHHSPSATSLENPSEWTNLDPDGASPMVGGGTACFDAAGDRVLWWSSGGLWEVTWPLTTPPPYGPAAITAEGGGVHVRWPGAVTAPYVAVIERSADGGKTWSRLTSAAPQSDGALTFSDSLPPASGTLAYRAVVERGGTLRVLGTTSLALGRTTSSTFALAPPRPNPARDDVVIELASPTDVDVTVELFDVTGRRVAATEHRHLCTGSAAFTLPLTRGVAPGVYELRVRDGVHTLTSRLAVVR